MVTSQRPSIDFSTFPAGDGTPVAEDRLHLQQMTNTMYSTEHHLAPRVRFVVGGNQFIYYNARNGRQHVAPDVYVALDVEPGMRAKWQTWLEGDKFPDVVFEITSESTQDEDLGHKVRLYERLGALEYYIYDPDQLLQPPLRAYHREGATFVEQPLLPGLAVYSPALEAELRVIGQWLRLIDPATGQPVPIPEEDYQARLEAEALARQEARARLAAEQALSRMQQDMQAMLAELARLRGTDQS